jgi:uncharacterized LabA/DUF88 family protein
MYFIDGEYLKQSFQDINKSENIDYQNLPYKLNNIFFGSGRGIQGEIVRVYYYDAQCEPGEADYEDQLTFFNKLDGVDFYETRRASLVRKGKDKGRREQKGVDVLISVDMMSKAYEDHYDIAIVIMGDRDFLPLIKSIKNLTGKRVFGVVFEGHYSPELALAFDKHWVADTNNIIILKP